MEKPKYQIGDRIPLSQLVVRGIAPQKSGNYLYFVQIVESDNCFVGSEDELEETLSAIDNNSRELITSSTLQDFIEQWRANQETA
jgi:hypothetical protein